MNPILLSCRDVKKSYGEGVSKTEVLKGITLDFPVQSSCAILGASGAGKSTLLHVLSALENPDEGVVEFEGKSLQDSRQNHRAQDERLAEFRNRSIGFVFQFHHLLPEFSALENAAMPLLMRGQADAYQKAKHYLGELGLKHRFDHRPAQLSGGEQQRVAVARALVTEPKILFADEPTGNLDHENSQKLIDLLMKANQAYGVALVVVTHNQEIAKKFSRIIRLDDGKVQG